MLPVFYKSLSQDTDELLKGIHVHNTAYSLLGHSVATRYLQRAPATGGDSLVECNVIAPKDYYESR